MGNIGIENLAALLAQTRADAQGSVYTGSTDQVIVLAGVDLGDASFANGYAVFDAGALGATAPKTWAQVSSNTATTITLTTALSATPSTGSSVWLYSETAVNVTATENVAQWGGVAVEAADSTGVVAFRLPYSESVPGDAIPSRAVQVAGTDGTDARALAVDSSGRLTPQPVGLVWDAAGYSVAANTNVFGTSYQPTTAGQLRLLVGNLSTGATANVVLVKTANSAPSGGSAGTRTYVLTSLAAGDLYTDTLAVTPNDSYNMQFSAATTVDITATFDPAD